MMLPLLFLMNRKMYRFASGSKKNKESFRKRAVPENLKLRTALCRSLYYDFCVLLGMHRNSNTNNTNSSEQRRHQIIVVYSQRKITKGKKFFFKIILPF